MHTVILLMGMVGCSAGLVLLHPLLLLLKVALGVHYGILRNDRSQVQRTLRKLDRMGHSSCRVVEQGEDTPFGVCVGFHRRWWRAYVVLVTSSRNSGCSLPELHLCGHVSVLHALMTSDSATVPSAADADDVGGGERKTLGIYDREGPYQYLYYSVRSLDVSRIATPRPEQADVVSDIVSQFRKHGHHTAYIYGKPGTGKTTVALQVALATGGSFVKSFNPTDPGDYLINLYNRVMPSKEKPLVLLLDEVDTIIAAVHHGSIAAHPKVPIPVRDKMTFNRFLDDVNQMWDHVILIMTSNVPKSEIDALDGSYLRPGRVDRCYTM